MISFAIWFDKLPQDKVNYYNKTSMSIEMFSYRLELASQIILEDFKRNGYYDNPKLHLIERD